MGKFNEGDIIRRTNNDWGQVPVGTICKVTSVDNEDSIQHIYTDAYPYSLNPGNFELVFPKKWYIRGSEELARWQKYEMEDKCNCGLWSNYYSYYLIDDDLIYGWVYYENSRLLPDDYTVITFEQFQKNVVNKFQHRKPFKLTRNGKF
jgi:hypothetical protein